MDGGYIVDSRSAKETRILYSFGLGHDWSFEESFNKLCENENAIDLIYGWDYRVGFNYFFLIVIRGVIKYSVRIIPFSELKKRFSEFYSYCLFWKLKKNNKHFRKLADINVLRDLDAEGESFSIKMDIEGAEWLILKSKPKVFKRANFIVLEVHNLHSNMFEFREFIDWLKDTHWISHLHVNNSGGIVNSIPRVLEITFSSMKFAHEKSQIDKLPIPQLDFSCAPALKDYEIRFFSD